jgi:aspartyl-tRNA(Asn)/glutamyl-tRNA(Gln) amidotransferase subunit C
MKVDTKLVDNLAQLARLEFDGDEKEKMIQDLNRMLDFVEKLNEMPTEGLEPLIYLTDETNVLREDEAIKTISHEEALQNAPQRDSDYFKTPKVIDHPNH